jgi:hypothetical protein
MTKDRSGRGDDIIFYFLYKSGYRRRSAGGLAKLITGSSRLVEAKRIGKIALRARAGRE